MSNEKMLNLDELINSKEEEIKKILNSKVIQLNKTLQEKEILIKTLQENFDKLKSDYEFNYSLIEERDIDLKIYEDKIDTFLVYVKVKDEEIDKLKIINEEMSSKFQNERIKRENNEELLKFNLSKNNSQSKEEKRILSSTIENLKRDLENSKSENKKCVEELKYLNEIEKRKLKDDLEILLSKIKIMEKEFEEREQKLKIEFDDCRKNLSKVNNENLSLTKEKIHLENSLKIFEGKESESSKNNFIAEERGKFLIKENEEIKLEISKKNYKIENLTKLNEDISTEIYSLKQIFQMKEFELEKKNSIEKNRNEKIRELSSQIESLNESKRDLDKELEEEKIKTKSLHYKLKSQNEEISDQKIRAENFEEEKRKYLEQIEILKKKLKENIHLQNLNENLFSQNFNENLQTSEHNLNNLNNVNNFQPNTKNNSLIDFFTSNQTHAKTQKQKIPNPDSEKDFEIARLNKELDGAKNILNKAESDMHEAFQLFRENENKLLDKINKLDVELIRKELELKDYIVNNLHTAKEALNEGENLKELEARLNAQIVRKSNIIAQLKQKILSNMKESERYKKERDKLAEMCNVLRGEINYIENVRIVNDEYKKSFYDGQKNVQNVENSYDKTLSNQNHHGDYNSHNSFNSYNTPSNGFDEEFKSEYEEFKKKKNSILKKEKNSYDNMRRKVENVVDKAGEISKLNTRRDLSLRSNGSVANSNSSFLCVNSPKSPNLRTVQIENLRRHSSRSKSKSKSPDSYIFKDSIKIVKIDYNNEKRNRSSELNTVNHNNLKLLKRNRIKFDDVA